MKAPMITAMELLRTIRDVPLDRHARDPDSRSGLPRWR
jgi:hypothetical protein